MMMWGSLSGKTRPLVSRRRRQGVKAAVCVVVVCCWMGRMMVGGGRRLRNLSGGETTTRQAERLFSGSPPPLIRGEEETTPHRDRRLSATSSILGAAGTVEVLGAACCVVTAALCAGLTLGVVSVEPMELRVVVRTGSKQEKQQAKRLLRLVDREPRHQVLVTLLLLNSGANEALPIFLDALVPSWAAVLLSVTVVLLFGEILPSAVFTGPKKLALGAWFAPLVSCAVFCLTPLAYPIALLLDRCLPEDDDKRYTTRDDLGALVDVQRDDARRVGLAEPFSEDEADLIKGAMALSRTSVADVMIPLDKVFTLAEDRPLDKAAVRDIHAAGFSRIPVVRRDGHVRDYLLLKDVLLDIADAGTSSPRTNGSRTKRGDVRRTVGDLSTRPPVWIGPDHSLFDLLNEFQTGTTHMAFVVAGQGNHDAAATYDGKKKLPPHSALGDVCPGSRFPGAVVGVLTLEDIIEEILTEEIYDEHDRANAFHVLQRFFKRTVLPKLRTAVREKKNARRSNDAQPEKNDPAPRVSGSADRTNTLADPLLPRGSAYRRLASARGLSLTSVRSPLPRGLSERGDNRARSSDLSRASGSGCLTPRQRRRPRFNRRASTSSLSASAAALIPPRTSHHLLQQHRPSDAASASASRLLLRPPLPLRRTSSSTDALCSRLTTAPQDSPQDDDDDDTSLLP